MDEQKLAARWGKLVSTLAPYAVGATAGGAAAGGTAHMLGRRRRMTTATVSTPGGRFKAFGQRSDVTRLAKAVKSKDVRAIAQAADKLLFAPMAKTSAIARVEKVLTTAVDGHRLRMASIPDQMKSFSVAVDDQPPIIPPVDGKKKKVVADRQNAFSTAVAKVASVLARAGRAKGMSTLAKALVGAGVGTAGAVGAGATWAGMKGRDFRVMDTPLGAVAGRRRDLRRLVAAGRGGDRQRFDRLLSRVVPVHPAATAALRQAGRRRAGKTAAAPLGLFGRAGAWLSKRFAGSAVKPMAKAVRTAAGARRISAPCAIGAGMMKKTVAKPVATAVRTMAGAKRMSVPCAIGAGTTKKMVGRLASAGGTAANVAKKKMSLGTKALIGAGGLAVGGTYLAGKGLGEVGKTLRVGMVQQPHNPLARTRFG